MLETSESATKQMHEALAKCDECIERMVDQILTIPGDTLNPRYTRKQLEKLNLSVDEIWDLYRGHWPEGTLNKYFWNLRIVSNPIWLALRELARRSIQEDGYFTKLIPQDLLAMLSEDDMTNEAERYWAKILGGCGRYARIFLQTARKRTCFQATVYIGN